MNIQKMIDAGYRPMVSRSCTRKRDEYGRVLEVFYFMRAK